MSQHKEAALSLAKKQVDRLKSVISTNAILLDNACKNEDWEGVRIAHKRIAEHLPQLEAAEKDWLAIYEGRRLWPAGFVSPF